MRHRSLIAFAGLLVAAALCACGGGGGGSSTPPNNGPTSSPSPTPGAIALTTSPSPLVISVSGANGVARAATFTATQSSATGNLTLGPATTSPCYSATPASTDLTQLESVTQNYQSSTGVAQLGFQLVAVNPGTCTLTITPTSGTATTVTVSVTL